MPSIASPPEILARHLMVDGVRRLVADERVLAAMRAVPREELVTPGDRTLAYSNRTLPAEGGGTLAEPLVVARVLAALQLHPGDRALAAGGDGGYLALLLARLVHEVIAVEPRDVDSGILEKRLVSTGSRICLLRGDPLEGWEEQAPFDAIGVTQLQTEVPPALVAQLSLGGRLVVPMRDADGAMLARIVREGPGRIRLDRLGALLTAPDSAAPGIARAG